MYKELYQYLISHKKLAVPGIGTFSVEREPAINDFSNRIIHPAVFSVNLNFPAGNPTDKFYQWLSGILAISEIGAVNAYNDFTADLKSRIAAGETIDWKGVGILSKGLAGEVKFKSAINNLGYEVPVKAEKIIRENAEHMVRVGEDEKTSAEMIEILNQPDEKKSYWWAYALIVGLLAVIFLGWYFSEHGVTAAATSNNKPVKLQEQTATYKILP
jgi:hypothetical protein